MSNKQWFAWIPVLGERLLWPRLFSGSRQNEFIETNWSDITNAYSFEGELFGKISGQLNNPGDSYYISTEEKGCTDTVDDTVKVQSIKIIVFEPGTALDPFLVPRFAFIAQAREKNQAYRINTIAMVKSFDRNGLYSFELENISSISSLGQIGKDQPAREIHRLIRDFFHQHIHNLADKVIPPVYASNPVEASERMWEEYFGGLVGITAKHSTAAILRNLRNNYQKIPHSLRRDYCSAASEAIGGYIGKLQYGSSFCAKLLNQAYHSHPIASRRESWILQSSGG